jgi:hypothetical protein
MEMMIRIMLMATIYVALSIRGYDDGDEDDDEDGDKD